jgi:hypothetical protein
MSDPRAAFIEAATWHDYEGAKYLPCSGLRVGDTIPSR